MRARLAPCLAPCLAACLIQSAALAGAAACDVESVKLEDRIAARSALQRSANEQTVRDLRTLRDAAIVLEAYKFETECERLVAIVKTLSDDPETAIEQSGDTDEEKAEQIERTREPKVPAAKVPAAKVPAENAPAIQPPAAKP